MQSSPSLPSPTFTVQPRYQIIHLLLQLNSCTSDFPEYPDPPTDRLRGMIYAAACQRIQTRAKLTNENLKKAFDFVKIFTDLTGFLYPLHSYDLQVEICVKLALFQLLLSDKDAIKEFEKLRSYMASGPAFNAMNTSSPVVDSRFIHYLAEEAGFIPPSPSEISPPSSPMRTDGPSKGKGFGSISQTRVQLALMESIIHTLVQSRSSIGQQNEKGIKIQSEKFNMEGLFKILPNWIFPLDEFDEEEYGKIYLPVTENFVGFTRAVSQISLTLIEQTKSSPISGQTITDSQEIYQVSTIMAACNTHHSKLQVPRVALEETLNCYTSLRKSFQPHPQLWKFADAYLRGFVGATLGSSEGFKNLFMSDWKIVLQNEWHKKRTSTNMFSYRRMSAASNANEMEVDEVEVPIKSESVRRKSIVEEYDSWEFLR